MEKQIWTLVDQPFTLGKGVYIARTSVPVIEEREIGHGFKAFSFVTPQGQPRVAESITGGIVGNTLDQVQSSVEECSREEVMDQIQHGMNLLDRHEIQELSPEKFFRLYKH